jgi:hypothetical protein
MRASKKPKTEIAIMNSSLSDSIGTDNFVFQSFLSRNIRTPSYHRKLPVLYNNPKNNKYSEEFHKHKY